MWLALILLAITAALSYALLRRGKPFWKEYGVNQVPHASLKNNIEIFVGKGTVTDFDEIVYKSIGDAKFCGFTQLGTHFFLPKDLEIVKKILIKDFDHFVDRRTFGTSPEQPVWSKMLVNLRGEEWKGVRTSLSPTFTTGKIRRMMDCLNIVSHVWLNHLKDEINKNGGKTAKITVLKEATSFTVDVIAAAMFGMDTATITEPNSLISKMIKKIFAMDVWSMIKFGLSVNLPGVVEFFKIKVIDDEALTFFETVLSKRLKDRESGKEPKKNDFIQLIVEARQGKLSAKGSDELSSFEKEAMLKTEGNAEWEKKNWLKDDLTAAAQFLGFFLAGFSTTSNLVGTIIYALALHQEVQDKLRDEINNSEIFKNGGEDADYDEVNKLVYLDMVVCEVLRLYPALGRLDRICVKEYKDKEYGFTIPKGAIVAIPVQGIHHDAQYYERPHEFYPEHFTPEQKAKRSPYAFQAFGHGARSCIGMRFALVETKACIAHLIRKFKVQPSEKTPIPQRMKPAQIAYQVPDDLELLISLA